MISGCGYSFETPAGGALDNLRPLRGEAEIEVEDAADRPARRTRSRKWVEEANQIAVSPVPNGAAHLGTSEK